MILEIAIYFSSALCSWCWFFNFIFFYIHPTFLFCFICILYFTEGYVLFVMTTHFNVWCLKCICTYIHTYTNILFIHMCIYICIYIFINICKYIWVLLHFSSILSLTLPLFSYSFSFHHQVYPQFAWHFTLFNHAYSNSVCASSREREYRKERKKKKYMKRNKEK